jgi:hypothetical protein
MATSRTSSATQHLVTAPALHAVESANPLVATAMHEPQPVNNSTSLPRFHAKLDSCSLTAKLMARCQSAFLNTPVLMWCACWMRSSLQEATRAALLSAPAKQTRSPM